MARVGVVTVTYRSGGTIGACIASLRTASAHPVELVIVDNASDDASVAAAHAADPAATVIARPSNDGYGAANNVGVAALAPDTEFVLYANPDTVWPAGSLDALVEQAAGDPSIGVLSPTLLSDDGTRQAIVEDDLSLVAVLRGMTRLGKPIRPRSDSGDVDWVHTAAALVPIDIVRATGGFDERFFLFGEDADFCRRVRLLGRRVVVTPDVEVGHVGGASVDATHDTAASAALRTRALATYLEKYQGRPARRVFGAVGTAVYGAVGHRGQAREAWKAFTR